MAAKENFPDAETGKDKKKGSNAVLPVLVEFTITFSVIILLIIFFSVVGISLLTGAKLLDMVIRTSVALLVVGVLLMLITRQIFSDVMNTGPYRKEEVDPMENGSTSEVK